MALSPLFPWNPLSQFRSRLAGKIPGIQRTFVDAKLMPMNAAVE
jgi:hypothetical protein